MKHFILMLVLSLVCGFSHAQGFIDHIVQRGETLEYLAKKFGISEQDIRDQNEDFNLDFLYVGLLIQIPIPEVGDSQEEIERQVTSMSVTSSILNEANSLYNNGSYRKAIKLYNAAIKDDASSDIYYLRGRCFLYQGKYKSAIRDLERANTGEDLVYSLRSSCELLLAEAYNRREAQIEARREVWGNLFAMASMTTMAVLEAKAASETSYSSYSGVSTGSNAGSSAFYSSSGSSSSSNTSSSTSSTRQCPSCQNLKHCSQCRGTGYRTDNMLGTGQDSTKKCGICGGSGVCPKCKGTGRI